MAFFGSRPELEFIEDHRAKDTMLDLSKILQGVRDLVCCELLGKYYRIKHRWTLDTSHAHDKNKRREIFLETFGYSGREDHNATSPEAVCYTLKNYFQ